MARAFFDGATIVDCDGPALLAALDAGASVIKPNRHELIATVGAGGAEGIAALRRRAPHAIVVASDGPNGLLCSGPAGRWQARPDRALVLVGNPTGAGDAVVAALALGMVRGDDLPAMLRAAIGASGAAVLAPVAGEIDPVVVRRFAGLAQVAAR
ncbi:MAG: PfkB family carbohydrate kinase [Tetrasphaera sp.]